MKRRAMISSAVVLGVCAVMLMWGGEISLAGAEHEFVGAAKCKMCHQKPDQGEQYKIWQESKHAKALETLKTPAAKEVAAKLGIEDPSTSGKCLKCHSTAYNFTEEKVTDAIDVEESISCESCHGAGKDYMKKSVMEDRDAAVAAGLVIPDESVCIKCHNSESPTYQPFNYAERVEKIKHSIPNKG